jgi:hypothetical protein
MGETIQRRDPPQPESRKYPTDRRRLEPDRDELEVYVDAVLRYRGTEGFISLRSFYDDEEAKQRKEKPRICAVSLKGNFAFLIDCAVDEARRAAQHPRPMVFAPPLCVFGNADNAAEQDILAGLLLSVECDRHPHEARRQLEELLGPATCVVRSGGLWINNDDGEVHDKLHLHWRLAKPALSKEDLAALKGARTSAARLVGGDGTNNPVCHPIRWPGSWHRKKEPRLCSIVEVNPLGAFILVVQNGQPFFDRVAFARCRQRRDYGGKHNLHGYFFIRQVAGRLVRTAASTPGARRCASRL